MEDKKKKKTKNVFIEYHDDEHLEMAARLARDKGAISTSLIQKTFVTGFARAAHLIDRLEELYIIAPQDGAKPRKLITESFVIRRKKPPKVLNIGANGKNKGGGPTKFTDALGHTICVRIAHGESRRQICKDEDMPSVATIIDWLLDPTKEAFQKEYEKALISQSEVLFDETLEISDDGTNDWMDREVGKDRIIRTTDHENINRSRLRVDTRKWYISKVLPKKFGEKLDVTSDGKRIKQPRPAVINYIVPEKPKE